MKTEQIESFSPEDTFAFGEQIGRQAVPGQVYTLIGDLGVGKTVFTQGVAAGLGSGNYGRSADSGCVRYDGPCGLSDCRTYNPAVPAGKSFIESKAAGAHESGIQAAPSL